MNYHRLPLRPAAWVAPVLLALAGVASGADLTIRGPILEVDPDGQKITVRQPDLTPLALRIDEDSEILLDGKAAKLAELAKGQKAVVQYRKDLAAKIEVKTQEAASAEKPAPAEPGTNPPPAEKPADKKDSQEKDSEKKDSTANARPQTGQGLVYLPIVGPVYLRPYRPVPRPVPVPVAVPPGRVMPRR
jgi:biotin carboxyl carrier protein